MTTSDLATAYANVDDSVLDVLRQIVGADRLSTGDAVREQHGHDESWHPSLAPDAVVFAQSTEEVSAVVQACAERKIPVIPFGTGTALEGGVNAVHGGISIDLTQMNAVLSVNAEDMDATVQAGVTRKQLNEHLRATGLFFAVDPGADASIGGMTATRASGTSAVRYGTMREAVLSMTVVLADGQVIRTSRRARKSAAGYDLTRLFVGSEGTLGVITEVTVRLFGIPEAVSAAVVSFPTIKDAVDSVIMTIQMGVPMARIEFVDEVQMMATNAYSNLSYPEQPTLFMEFHGTEAGVREQAELVGEVCADNGAGDFQWAEKAEDRTKLWQARHDAAYAASTLRPGAKMWATDVCVPISRLAECVVETRKDIDASNMIAPMVGHVGDGNFHLVLMVDPDDAADVDRAKELNDRLVTRAIGMDGTCTGEHGVGLGKIHCLEQEHGDALFVMRAVKRSLDPDNIMNPGKIVRL